MKARVLLLWAAVCAAGCSVNSVEPNDAGGGGGQAPTSAGSSGTASIGAAGGSNGAAGSAISAGVSGSGGSAGTGTAGGSGAAGSSGASGAGGSGSVGSGTQMDPGTEGDGTFAQPPPYDSPPESLSLIGGAVKGVVTGPFLHTQTGDYTGWDKWKFTFYVYVPAQYQPGHPAALMIFNDGYLYAGIDKLTDAHFNAPMVMDNLIKEGAMPVTIGVFIFPGTNDGHQVGGGDGGRSTQYDTPNDQYGKFLREEFLPANILNKYDIVSDPDGWAMAGHSSGGIASIIAGWYHSDRWP